MNLLIVAGIVVSVEAFKGLLRILEVQYASEVNYIWSALAVVAWLIPTNNLTPENFAVAWGLAHILHTVVRLVVAVGDNFRVRTIRESLR